MRVVHDNFKILQLVTDLSKYTVKPWRWSIQLLTVSADVLEFIFSSWENIALKHGSITMSTLSVTVAFGGVGSEIESTAKTLKFNVLPDALRIQARA